MLLGKFKKTPNEVKKYSIDYGDWLDTEEHVASISFSVVEGSGIFNVFLNTLAVNATDLTFFVSGGIDGQTYKVLATMTTTENQVKQDTILFLVKDA